MNELKTLKRDFERALSRKDAACLALMDRIRPRCLDKYGPLYSAWANLYYAQPVTKYAANLRVHLVKLGQLVGPGLDPEGQDALRVLALAVEATVAAAVLVEAIKGQLPAKGSRRPTRSVNSSRYRFSREYGPVAPADIKIGDYLLLRYGNGTQLARVVGISPRRRLQIRRLHDRGTSYAAWKDAADLSRNDDRILGLGQVLPQDPRCRDQN